MKAETRAGVRGDGAVEPLPVGAVKNHGEAPLVKDALAGYKMVSNHQTIGDVVGEVQQGRRGAARAFLVVIVVVVGGGDADLRKGGG
jgi:Na+-transporting NADH:ubiquinone oxidoreductase subunit NqrA